MDDVVLDEVVELLVVDDEVVLDEVIELLLDDDDELGIHSLITLHLPEPSQYILGMARPLPHFSHTSFDLHPPSPSGSSHSESHPRPAPGPASNANDIVL